MYSGGNPYYSAIRQPPFDKQGGGSYFALENDNWVIIGLDSARFSPEETLYINGLLAPMLFTKPRTLLINSVRDFTKASRARSTSRSSRKVLTRVPNAKTAHFF
jgi:hypothetical protein